MSSRRWASLDASGAQAGLLDAKARANASAYQLNIESFVGTVSTPVGIAGPLRVYGRNGTTDYRVPLATTGAALVASYNRGSRLLTAATWWTLELVACARYISALIRVSG